MFGIEVNVERKLLLNDETSYWSHENSAIRKGFILDPVLFSIYVNDLNSNLLNEISKFADDNKLGDKAG